VDVPESREKTVMSRRKFGEDGTFVRWNFRRIARQHGRRFLCDNFEICVQFAEDLCKRVSVAAHQRIGRCARELQAAAGPLPGQIALQVLDAGGSS